MHRSVRAVPVVALLVVAGCSDDPEPVSRQDVAVCFSPEGEVPPNGRFDVEFRQDGEVVAEGSTTAGIALGVEVPAGEVDVYVNGEFHGQAYTAAPAADDGEAPVGGVYLSAPGCPEEPPFG
ncbi:hypothetical protein [Kineococcus sp. G2]|uniref:hypothetical protein n=1 Tax=Kineococcus sp. G2 TaxID=3127484 RepID=UPI00301E4741